MKVVSNASPLILLSGVGLFSFLQQQFQSLNISQSVFDEVVTQGTAKAGREEVATATRAWVNVHASASLSELKKLKVTTDLSRADRSVIALAQHIEADLVLADEISLRKALIRHGFEVAGTGGIMILLKKMGLIEQVQPYLQQAVEYGMRLDKQTFQQILIRAGEIIEDE
jgi:hypothetical protein